MTVLLKITDLHVHFHTPVGVVKANNGVNLEVADGESVGIMGESGCGKTVFFLSLLRLQQPGKIVRGSILFNGKELVTLPEKSLHLIRGREIGFIPQNQATALNPAFTVEQHLNEVIRLRAGKNGLWSQIFTEGVLRGQTKQEVVEVLHNLGLGEDNRIERLLKNYPHQLSGGMRQRVLTAMALLFSPRMLIADEPTTALDRATRQLSLELLKDIKNKTTLLLVSHDIEAIESICSRVAVMYGGRIIEYGPASAILNSPRHPYTRILLACNKIHDKAALPELAIESQDLIKLPAGCAFHPFCPEAFKLCSDITPVDWDVGEVMVACHRYHIGVNNA